jgi:type VI secretion system protein ImpA
MPLRDDLLAPIAGSNPVGEDLYYDKVFEQIKEAGREDVDDLPDNGLWELAKKKKADHRGVIKLAGEALATRTKDLRLAGWLVEGHLRVEGFSALVPGIDLLRSLQETFWPGIYPAIEEGNDLEMRALAIQTAGKLIAGAVRKAPLTRKGLNFEDYLDSRAVGYEKDATASAQQEARKYAKDHGRLTAEEFDEAFAASPKSLYADADLALAQSLEATDRLDEFQRDAYGESRPNLSKLRDGLEEVHRAVRSLLNERRKIDPDPVSVEDKAEVKTGEAADAVKSDAGADGESASRPVRDRTHTSGQITCTDDAYAQVVDSAEFLFSKDPKSPVPYLVCTALRLGETRMQGPTPSPGFAVGPTSQVRQSLRLLASKGAWHELMAASLPILASECARAWLDLHRYIWRAGKETGAEAISEAVVGTVKSLLISRPELRHWTLEDDTGAANSETQQWLDRTVLP